MLLHIFLSGAYIGEYRPKIKKWVLGLLFACCIAYQTIKTYITANGENFYNGVCADYEDLITVLTGTILFLLIYDINVKNLPVRAIFAMHFQRYPRTLSSFMDRR